MQQVIVIEPGRRERNYWLDLWRYRELFRVLAWRDLSVRYKQTVIGLAWALVRPILTLLVFTVIFGRIAHLPSDGNAPYPLMVFAGMLPWTFFSTGLNEASSSLINNANLISKVYFPRLIVPTATMVVAFTDFLISLLFMAVLMAWYRFVPGWRIMALPAFVAFGFFAAVGPSLWITALNVKYRDFRYVIPFVVQFGLYISPVGFSSNVVPQPWRLLYSLNPMVGVIDGFRWCILGGQSELYLPGLAVSAIVTAFFAWFGIHRFRTMEKSFADLI
jgi:lipopolysaccharide transport system permease protein